MPKKLRNTSARPVKLHDGTLLVPTEETEVPDNTFDELHKSKVANTGKSQMDMLKEHHGIEVVGESSKHSKAEPSKPAPREPDDDKTPAAPPPAATTHQPEKFKK